MELSQFFPKEIKGSFVLRNPKGSKPSLIYLLVRIGGRQLKLSTRVKCYPQHWNKKKQEVYVNSMFSESDNRNNIIANNKIAQVKLSLESFLTYVCNNPIDLSQSAELIREFIYKTNNDKKMKKRNDTFDVFKYLKKCIIEDNVEDSSKNTYQRNIQRFEEFAKAKGYTFKSFNDITKSLIVEYQKYLCGLTNQPKCRDGKLSVNYINNLIKVFLQRLDNYAVKNDMMDKNILENAKTYKTIKSTVRSCDNTIALRDDEVYKLFNFKAKSKQDEDIKNLFCLNCVTGQRISDTNKIDNNINSVANITTIQLKQKKCGSLIDVPILFKMAIDILEKYPEGLPYVSEAKINDRIKVIAKEANVGTDKKTIARQSGNSTKATTENVYRYELISTHTARRTFITMLALRGYDARFIKDYSGHADIRMVELYSKTSPSEREYFEVSKKNIPHMILPMVNDSTKEIDHENVKSSMSIDFLKDYKEVLTKKIKLEIEKEQSQAQLQKMKMEFQYLKDFEDVLGIDSLIDEISKKAEQADQNDIFVYHERP